jgi:hypothetical protein
MLVTPQALDLQRLPLHRSRPSTSRWRLAFSPFPPPSFPPEAAASRLCATGESLVQRRCYSTTRTGSSPDLFPPRGLLQLRLAGRCSSSSLGLNVPLTETRHQHIGSSELATKYLPRHPPHRRCSRQTIRPRSTGCISHCLVVKVVRCGGNGECQDRCTQSHVHGADRK